MDILIGEPNIEIVRVKNIDPETLRTAVRDVDAIIVRQQFSQLISYKRLGSLRLSHAMGLAVIT